MSLVSIAISTFAQGCTNVTEVAGANENLAPYCWLLVMYNNPLKHLLLLTDKFSLCSIYIILKVVVIFMLLWKLIHLVFH